MMNFVGTNSPIYSYIFREQEIVTDAVNEESWKEWRKGIKKFVMTTIECTP